MLSGRDATCFHLSKVCIMIVGDKMKSKHRITVLISLGILSLPVSAAAKMVPMSEPFGSLYSIVAVVALLFSEGIVIAALARPSHVYRMRFASVWFFVTLLTWIPFFASLVYLHRFAGILIGVAIGETAVVMLEAGAIWVMLRVPFFARQTANPPSPLCTLYYSAVANAVSLCGGLIVASI